jgi:hypothetical protein
MPAWDIVLCRFRGHPWDAITPEFCRTFFLEPEAGGLYDYLRDISYGKITLDGSRVLGPVQLSFTPEHAFAERVADEVSRQLDLSRTDGILFFYNAIYDTGGFRGAGITVSHPDGTRRSITAAHFDPSVFRAPAFGHTVAQAAGRMLGLGPSFLLRPRAVHGDGWDIMGGRRMDGSGGDCRFDSPNPALLHTRSGPGMNAPNLRKLAVLDASRVAEYRNDGREMLTLLAALNHAEVPWPLALEVPLSGDYARLSVELRWNDRWDRGIPRPAFLVHLIDHQGVPYLVPFSPRQHDWQPGQSYTTPDKDFIVDFRHLDTRRRRGLVALRPVVRFFGFVRRVMRRAGTSPRAPLVPAIDTHTLPDQ